MLTDLQVLVRRIIAQLPESGKFALAGGAALIISGIVERPTSDLDFFAPYPEHVSKLLDAAEAAFLAEGLQVTRLEEGLTFARLRVSSADDTTYVDLASDYRLQPATLTERGLVLAEEELAADKVLALAGRAAPRDFVDFARLVSRFDTDVLCELAGSKDLGFRREHLAAALSYFDRINPAMFDHYTGNYDLLRETLAAAGRALADSIRPTNPTDEESG